MGVIFVAGVYGVGKSTLCEMLSKILEIPAYSASDLISNVNGEIYGSNKIVKNKVDNQNILINQIESKLREHSSLLLAGHFCIFDKSNNVDRLPLSIFKSLHIDKVLLLEAEVEIIREHLYERDRKQYSYQQINSLMEAERSSAYVVACENNCSLFVHKMIFDQSDAEVCCSLLV